MVSDKSTQSRSGMKGESLRLRALAKKQMAFACSVVPASGTQGHYNMRSSATCESNVSNISPVDGCFICDIQSVA